MGLLNIFSNNDDDHHPVVPGTVKGPCAILREHGIDPGGLKFTLNQDGFVTVSGRVRNKPEHDRICRVIGRTALVSGVISRMAIAEPDVTTGDEADADAQLALEAKAAVSHTRQAVNFFKQAG